MSHHFYITTTLPYVNADPHIGFGWEITEADVIARYQRLMGNQVIFNTGTDEHGLKIYQKALEAGQEPQAYTDEYAARFSALRDLLDLSYTHFIRTTDEHHVRAAQAFWRRCRDNDDIYQAAYEVKYCVGCELAKTESELVNGRCPLHPNLELEIRTEENYYFRFSKYQSALLDLYQNNPEFVKPPERFKEIISFVENGLQDFSISRLKENMPWGVPVPDDDSQVMYVWFDALVNYISTLGWTGDDSAESTPTEFENYWPGLQVAGKDNLRQQSAMWQAMLLSAKLPPSKQVLINGFISVGGQKMSKSLGNVISPADLVERYGVDGARYTLLSLSVFNGDQDVSWERFDTQYTADLANGLGNLASRVAKMAEKTGLTYTGDSAVFDSGYLKLMNKHELTSALQLTIDWVRETDQFLSDKKPWLQEGEDQRRLLDQAVGQIIKIAYHLQPFMPATAKKLLGHFTAPQISAMTPLFPRLG
jgi:methionyl-tRNA synthetase